MRIGIVLFAIYLINIKTIFEFPAAKRNHHAFASGLAYHTLTMLHLGNQSPMNILS